jgi:serine/threonine-protein kinase
LSLPGSREYPERVGPYELLLPIASGGMAKVFLARKRGAGDFRRNVALKLTHAHLREQPGWAIELVEEAKLAARIRHPNVVQVLDVEDDPAGVFLVMEYVEGDTLAALTRYADEHGERVPLDIAMRILCDALAGLHAAHELRDDADNRPVGLVHRDFTPQNILVGIDGVTRLTDFGVAKAATRVTFTTTGVVKGKLSYMSPEQARAQPVDRRSDVWAAGVIAWELVTGARLRPESQDPVAAIVDLASRPPRRAREVNPEVPPALDEAIAGALVIDRARRWPTAEAFRERLVAACGTPLADPAIVADYVHGAARTKLEERAAHLAEIKPPASSAPPPARSEPPPPAPPRRARRGVFVVIGAALVVAAGLTAWTLRGRLAHAVPPVATAPPPPPPETASAPATTAPPEPSAEPAAAASEPSSHVRARPRPRPRARPSASAPEDPPAKPLAKSPYE